MRWPNVGPQHGDARKRLRLEPLSHYVEAAQRKRLSLFLTISLSRTHENCGGSLSAFFLQCVAVCCSVLQCVCCSVLQSATLCNTLQHSATLCNTLQHTATRMPRIVVAPCCSVLQCVCCSVLQSATLCNTLQHTATHCNTLQHTAKRVPRIVVALLRTYRALYQIFQESSTSQEKQFFGRIVVALSRCTGLFFFLPKR